MVTRGSRLIRVLEYFWNQFWSRDERVKLIICGSSSGWILKNIVRNRRGLYNRVTRNMRLRPFSLHDTKEFFAYKNIRLSDRDITDLYMTFGGIPFYLSKVDAGLSATQIVDNLGFKQDSFLSREFEDLYATLFGSEEAHIAIARIIAKHRYGIGLDDLAEELKVGKGGRLTERLKALEEAGFISRFTPYGAKRKGVFYKMIDEYSLFYFKWIEPIAGVLLEEGQQPGYWNQMKNSPSWYSWAGYAFESLCFKHIAQIRKALTIGPGALSYTWRYVPPKNSEQEGAQIDLLFNRGDNSITICEIKYSRQPFALDKEAAKKLNRQIEIFKKRTKTKKNIFICFVATEGLEKTLYSEEYVQGVATLKDLFKEVE